MYFKFDIIIKSGYNKVALKSYFFIYGDELASTGKLQYHKRIVVSNQHKKW